MFWLDLRHEDGRIRESCKTDSRRRAELYAARRLLELEDPAARIAKREITFGVLRDEWLLNKAEKKTLKDDKQRWRLILDYFGVDNPISRVTPAEIEVWKAVLQSSNYSAATVNHYLGLLRSAFVFAGRRKYPHTDPFATVVMLKLHNERKRVFTADEYSQILRAAKRPLLTAILLGAETGMRRTEISGLDWGRTHEVGEKPFIHISAGKTKNNEETYIPLVPAVVAELVEVRASRVGKPVDLTPDSITRKFGRLMRKLGIPKATFHDLRRSFATNLKRAGVGIVDAARLARHRNLETLRKHYLIVEDEELHSIRTRMK